eukprot:3579171-Ditylum_brightwellii.AAC.1
MLHINAPGSTNIYKYLLLHLAATKYTDLTLDPDTDKCFKVYVDVNFIGNLYMPTAAEDPNTVKPCSGYCLLIWVSKIQMQVDLSTCKAEYIVLTTTLRNILMMMQLMEEMKGQGINIGSLSPKVHCTAFEDNAGALELTNVSKMCPHTKHIDAIYHHF